MGKTLYACFSSDLKAKNKKYTYKNKKSCKIKFYILNNLFLAEAKHNDG